MANTFTKIAETTLSAAAANITFSAIPQTGYTDLQLVVSVRSTGSAAVATQLNVQFNGSATAVYSDRFLQGSGSGVSTAARTSQAVIRATAVPTSLATTNTFGNVSFYIPNYAGSTAKSISSDSVTENNGTESYQEINAHLWNSTAAITSIVLTSQDSGNFVIGSTASLYGILKGSGGATVS